MGSSYRSNDLRGSSTETRVPEGVIIPVGVLPRARVREGVIIPVGILPRAIVPGVIIPGGVLRGWGGMEFLKDIPQWEFYRGENPRGVFPQ